MKKSMLIIGMALATASGLAIAADSLYVAADGKVGVGTSAPETNIHVKDEGPAGPKTLFRIENTGNTKFGVKNNEANTEWAFANPGDEFRLSKQDSGVVEFSVLTGGNVVITGNLTEGSDRNAKTNIKEISNQEILTKVSELPITSWSYKHDPSATHIGPMAQDFYASFGLGSDDKRIATIDTSGVALAAIKALSEKVAALEAQLEEQKLVQSRLQALEGIAVELMQERNTQLRPATYKQ